MAHYVLSAGIENFTGALSKKKIQKQTTWFNYRRLNGIQLAVSNNSSSYILKESNDDDLPILKAYDLSGNYLERFELVSL